MEIEGQNTPHRRGIDQDIESENMPPDVGCPPELEEEFAKAIEAIQVALDGQEDQSKEALKAAIEDFMAKSNNEELKSYLLFYARMVA